MLSLTSIKINYSMQRLLSIILPCYNVENYIARCLDSLLCQNINHDLYEIICVDDCSKDNLKEIIISYQAYYPNIILIRHTVNKTAGGARNTGINYASGKYLWFVDPDDTVPKNILKELLSSAEEHSAEIFQFNYQTFDKNGELIETGNIPTTERAYDGETFINLHFDGKLSKDCMMVHALYKRSFIKDKDLCFPCIKASQDVIFAWKSLLYAKRVSSTSTTGYYIHKRDQSTTGASGRRKADATFSRTILFPHHICKLMNLCKSPNIICDLRNTIRWSINQCEYSLSQMQAKEKYLFYKFSTEDFAVYDGLVQFLNRRNLLILPPCSNYVIWRFRLATANLIGLLKRLFAKNHYILI